MLLRRLHTDDTIIKATTRIPKADLAIIDAIGLLHITADTDQDLYRPIDASYEKRSLR